MIKIHQPSELEAWGAEVRNQLRHCKEPYKYLWQEMGTTIQVLATHRHDPYIVQRYMAMLQMLHTRMQREVQ